MKKINANKIYLIFAGLLLSIFFIEISMRIAGFFYLSLQEYRNLNSIEKQSAYRILCLGESTTADFGNGNSWPFLLEKKLNKNLPELKFSVINKGIIGINTNDILEKIDHNLKTYKPDMVISMMGINDIEQLAAYNQLRPHTLKTILSSFRTYKLTKLIILHFKAMLHHEAKNSMIRPKLQRLTTDISKKEIEIEHLIKSAWDFNDINMLKKVITENPNDYKAYSALANWYCYQGNFDKSEKILQKAIELNPKDDNILIQLGYCYMARKQYDEAEKALKKALALKPQNDKLHGILSMLYSENKDYTSSRRFANQANKLRLKNYNLITTYNYQKLKNILKKKNIKLVCVQYPIRSIKPLKKMLEPHRKIIFIDNEYVFKNAVRQASYTEYFSDLFAGDFGHCTHKGNMLLADNIADGLCRDYFNKYIKDLKKQTDK